jgi:uncharacterized protein YjdB
MTAMVRTLRHPALLGGLLALFLVVGCTDMLVNPGPGRDAALSVRLQVAPTAEPEASGSLAEAFDRATAVRVRIVRPDRPTFDTTLVLPPPAQVRRVGPISVPMLQARERAQLFVDLLLGESLLFQSEPEEIELRAGATTESSVPVTAVPAGIRAPTSIPELTSLRDTVQLESAVVFGSGDPIPGLALTWSTPDTSIVELSPQGRLVARAEGDARIVGRFAEFTVNLTARVRPVVVSIDLAPAAARLQVGDSLRLLPSLRDARGNALPNRVVESWVSSDPVFASTDATGLVRALEPIEAATITAFFQGVSGTATVAVVPKPVASVTVEPATGSIEVDQQLQLAATLRAADSTLLTGRQVAWESSDTTVARVDGAGQVRGVTPGTVTVTATSEGVSGTARVVVSPKPVQTVEVSPATATLEVDRDLQLGATLRAADGTLLTGRPIEWSSDNPAVARVDSTGRVLAVAPGDAAITATSEGRSGSAQVRVVPKPVNTVQVSPAVANLLVGEQVQLSARLLAADSTVLTGRVVTWQSSDTMVARVSGEGLVSGRGEGEAVITATSEGVSGTAQIRVAPQPVARVQVDPDSAAVVVNGQVQLSARLFAADSTVLTGRVVTWQSSDTTVARVSGEGLVSGRGEGEAVITAASEGVSGTAQIRVTRQPVARVEVDPDSAAVVVNGQVQLSARLFAADSTVLTGRVVTWQSSDTTVARVSGEGLVSGRGEGEAVITAASEGVSGTAQIRVTPQPVDSVEVRPTGAEIEVGQQLQLEAILRAADGTILTGRVVAWESSATEVATVDSAGLVRGVGAGEAVITATSEGVRGAAGVVVLGGPHRIFGVVRELLSQEPLQGVSVVLAPAPTPSRGGVGAESTRQVFTDQNGRYRFDIATAGAYGLSVSAADFVGNAVEFIEIFDRPEGDVARIDFALATPAFDRPVGGFAGRVFDDGGRPIAGAVVMLSGGEQTNGVFRSTNSAGDGTYTFPGVVLVAADGNPIREFTLIAAAPGFGTEERSRLQVESGTTLAGIDFVLRPGESVVEFFRDGFEGELAWTASGFWNRTTGEGIRNLALPTYVDLAPDDPSQGFLPAAPQGTRYMWYGQPETGNFMGEQDPFDEPGSGGTSLDPNRGTLISPAFNIPGDAGRATLTFTTWFEIESVNPNLEGFDLMVVSVVDVDEGTVVEVARLNPLIDPEGSSRATKPFTSGGYNRVPVFRPFSVDLDAFRERTIRLRFEFDTVDERYNGFRGWIIDDVVVSDVGAPPAASRLTAPGTLLRGQCTVADEPACQERRGRTPPR